MYRFILSIALLLAFSPVSAQNLDGSNPIKIAQVIRDIGYNAVLGEDTQGNPKITGKLSRTSYSIYFYGCTGARGCNSIQFSAGYNLANGLDSAKVNEWNRTKRFGRVYVNDDSDPFLKLDLNLDYGVTDQNFRDSFDYWRLLVETFEGYINWG